jgi:hypothetical protein
MGRRSFTWEFKPEAGRLVRERGVTTAQASRDLGLSSNRCLGPLTGSLEHRNDPQIVHNRAAHNGADQARQALRRRGQR